MKNENVVKINKLGKVSRILIVIARVINMIAIVCLPIVCIAVFLIPNDAIKINGSASANIILDDDFPDHVFSTDMDETNFKGKILGTSLKWLVTDEETEDGKHEFFIDGSIDELSGKQLKYIALFAAIGGEVILICLYVALTFAKKLAQALEVCNSPFEEEVLNRMKVFGIALAVWAGAIVLFGGISGLLAVFLVIIVLLFISVFKYGAQLQQQADDTI